MNQLREQIESLNLKEEIRNQNKQSDMKIDSTKTISLLQSVQNYFWGITKRISVYYTDATKSIMTFLSPLSTYRKTHEDESPKEETCFSKSRTSTTRVVPTHAFSRVKLPTLNEIQQIQQLKKQKKNLILWDVENISYRHIDTILYHADVASDMILISVAPLQKRETYNLFPYILLYGITIYTDHEDSDAELIELLYKHYQSYEIITIVSSDTDFVSPIKKILGKKKKVQVIVSDSQKKGMLMRLNLDNKYLSIKTLYRRTA